MIRPAQAGDAASLAAIYNHYIRTTTITFEEQEVDSAAMAHRIEQVGLADLPWLILETDRAVVGYAYASKWRERSAYRFAVESTIYLDAGHVGKGHARPLYGALIEALRAKNLHTAIAGIALPNEASVGFHERLGFTKVAHFQAVGRKFEKWVDVGYWQIQLGSD